MIFKDIKNFQNYDWNLIEIDNFWDLGMTKEDKIHSVHQYPAKFPSFITTKALEYAKNRNIDIKRISDVFCGCGTVAYESKKNNIDFWGCDINPVATLIAKVKCNTYKIDMIDFYYNKIIKRLNYTDNVKSYTYANQRLKYWFKESQYEKLSILKIRITKIKVKKYRELFLCLFSSILKPSSKWLSKSIKPQIDYQKNEVDVYKLFQLQFKKYRNSFLDNSFEKSKSTIITGNFKNIGNVPKVDLIITSPPYVTSYEYADLHQLSSLWLEFTNDFRELRKGSIGSVYLTETTLDENTLVDSAKKIIKELRIVNHSKSKINSIIKYYLDMQEVVVKSHKMLRNNGMILFVIGDTEYKSIRIENSKHLVEVMLLNGFKDIEVVKRKISKKILTPYRDENGKFTKDKNKRMIYHEEYIIIGRKYGRKSKN